MKTAMQELIDELKEHNTILVKEGIEPDPLIKMYKELAEKLLEKEKEQIIDANRQGRCNDCPFMYSNEDAEQYYNQTYNQTNVGNDGFEFDNSSTIPPPKTNNLSKH
jgi:hypothetical protein